MKPLSRWITLCGIITFFAACNKENNDSPVAQKLHAGIWQLSGSEIVNIQGIDTVIDLYSTFRPCEQDDLITFDLDGTANTNEGADKCPEDQQTAKMAWELLDNDTKIKLTVGDGSSFNSTGGQTSTGTIVQLTDAILVVRTEGFINSTPVIVVETHKNIR